MLLSATLQENLLLGLPSSGPIERTIHNAVLDHDVSRLPDGPDTLVGTREVRLSGGQIQRAAIARTLARAPDLFVLDDVSSALDHEAEALLWQRLLTSGATYLVTSHQRAVLERADQIVILDGGRVQAVGTLAELESVRIGFGMDYNISSP